MLTLNDFKKFEIKNGAQVKGGAYLCFGRYSEQFGICHERVEDMLDLAILDHECYEISIDCDDL